MKPSVTRLDYCQYLLVSQINYTLTNFADHCESFSHDEINRYLRAEKLTPRLIWDNVQAQVVPTANAYLVFDDTVLDKNYSFAIELVRRPWSGNAKTVIKGIGVVTGVYVNPDTNQFWLLDYRLYDPDGDGKTKLDPRAGHDDERRLSERPAVLRGVDGHLVRHQRLDALHRVTGKDLLLSARAINRSVDDSGGTQAYRRVDSLTWSESELQQGKRIKIKGFPKDHKVQCFRVEVSTHRTDYVVTNDRTQDSTAATQKACGYRWKIEQLHREGKQVTGLERCEGRKARIQRNHSACAFLVWVRLKALAVETGRTVYQLKHGLLADYLIQQLKHPSLKMALV